MNTLSNNKTNLKSPPRSLLTVLLILLTLLSATDSFAQRSKARTLSQRSTQRVQLKQKQNPEAEIFQPKTTQRTQKEVEAYLPFHTQKRKVSIEFVDGMAVMEGDIVLGPASMYSGDVAFAVVIDGETYRWKNGVIPYTIQSGHPKRQAIMQAIQHIQEQTNLRLVQRSNEKDYVHFISGDGCSSRVGRCGGKQKINIGSCSFGSIVHEILHSAGLWHEQSREDRNNHITINWDNIKSDKKHNFKKHVSDGIDIGHYDCNSLMHYPAYAFSKNGLPTITGKTCNNFGQRRGMSPSDIAAINQLYKVKIPSGLTNKPWYLTAKHSGKVIDISGGNRRPKANVQQHQLNNSEAQKFRFIHTGGGYYYIQNVGSNLVLDVQGGLKTRGTNVWQYGKNGTDAQKWRLVDAGGGYYSIRSKLGDLNLDIKGGLKTNGTNIQVWTINNSTAQQFRFKEAQHAPPPKDSYGKALEHYWNGSRKDNFTTATTKGKNNALAGGYKFVRVDGYVLNKSSSTEGQAVPLYLYYSNARKDNFTTATREGIRAAEAAGYRNAGIEGYVLKTVKVQYRNLYKPLWLYYSDARKDNFVTATKQGMAAAEAGGYRKVRIEGYVRIDNFSNLAPQQGKVKR